MWNIITEPRPPLQGNSNPEANPEISDLYGSRNYFRSILVMVDPLTIFALKSLLEWSDWLQEFVPVVWWYCTLKFVCVFLSVLQFFLSITIWRSKAVLWVRRLTSTIASAVCVVNTHGNAVDANMKRCQQGPQQLTPPENQLWVQVDPSSGFRMSRHVNSVCVNSLAAISITASYEPPTA